MNAKDLVAGDTSHAIAYVLQFPCQQVLMEQGAEFQGTLHMEKFLVDCVLKRYQHASMPTHAQAPNPAIYRLEHQSRI